MSAQYEVEKFGRGSNGQWFGYGARRFASESAARAYFAAFAADQLDVLNNGIRIDLRVRAGRRLLATVGGQLDSAAAKQIREVAVVSAPVLVLGRDGMGDATESDFDAWVSYVCAHIDERAGFEVAVDERAPRDVQDDTIIAGTDEQREIIDEAKRQLWEDWCAEGAPQIVSRPNARHHGGRPCTLPPPWRALAARLGGVQALADALGVTARTVRRWAAGERTPSALQRRDVRERLATMGLRAPWRE